jgi:DNA-binding MarR family transcriptional regulator
MCKGIHDAGFITYLPNPAHKRSCLIQLTEEGIEYIRQHDERIAGFLDAHMNGCREELSNIVATVKELRVAFANMLLLDDIGVDDSEPANTN